VSIRKYALKNTSVWFNHYSRVKKSLNLKNSALASPVTDGQTSKSHMSDGSTIPTALPQRSVVVVVFRCAKFVFGMSMMSIDDVVCHVIPSPYGDCWYVFVCIRTPISYIYLDITHIQALTNTLY